MVFAWFGWSVPHGPPWRTDQPSGRSSALRPELSADAQSGPDHDPGTFCDPGDPGPVRRGLGLGL
jgi:hypothetical protein